MTTKISDRLENVTMPVPVPEVDVPRLKKFVGDLLTYLGIGDVNSWLATNSGKQALNLTHHPLVTGNDRFLKMAAGHMGLKELHAKDIWEHDFTEIPTEVKKSYVGTLIDQIGAYHLAKYGTPLRGRHQLVWLVPGHCYDLHVDNHTTYRYHIPIVTNPLVLWTFRQGEQIDVVHMPADGRVWELDPIRAEHTVANHGTSARIHLIITSI